MELDRELVGARASIALAFAVAALSVVTGLIAIGDPNPPAGWLATVLPAVVVATAGFTGALTGFLMLASALGLRRGFSAAWYSTVILLPLTAAQGLLQTYVYSLPLVVVSLVALPVLLLNRRRFTREVELTTTQLAALLAVVGAQVYGTVGTYALRDEFNGVGDLTDAFWYTIVTATTVGYGDMTPRSAAAKLFGVSVLLVTVSSFAVALGVLLTPAIEARLSKALGRMTDTQIDLLENHVLVLGYGDLTEPILEELGDKTSFVVITPDPERARALVERGFNVLTGDPSDEDLLLRAHVERARAVVAATNNDAEDALAILTARQLNPEVRIVASATERENVNKLKRAGADTVISPTALGGHLLAESALGGRGTEAIAERVLSEEPSRTD